MTPTTSKHCSADQPRRRVAIFGNRHQGDSLPVIIAMLSRLAAMGVELMIDSRFANYLRNEGVGESLPIRVINPSDGFEADFAISLGGDGTVLRTARWVASHDIPVLAVNTGHLGYLSAVGIDHAALMACAVLKGDYVIERRQLLRIEGEGLGDLWPYALNEVAVIKEDTSSMITIDAVINGYPLATYQADGLIVSTPTGSTGYNLSVGGPIVEPSAPVLVVSPIAAHSLTMRPLVVADTSHLRLTTTSRADTYRVSLDGRSVTLPSGSSISVRAADLYVDLIQPQGHVFTDTLRLKLLWGRRGV